MEFASNITETVEILQEDISESVENIRGEINNKCSNLVENVNKLLDNVDEKVLKKVEKTMIHAEEFSQTMEGKLRKMDIQRRFEEISGGIKDTLSSARDGTSEMTRMIDIIKEFAPVVLMMIVSLFIILVVSYIMATTEVMLVRGEGRFQTKTRKLELMYVFWTALLFISSLALVTGGVVIFKKCCCTNADKNKRLLYLVTLLISTHLTFRLFFGEVLSIVSFTTVFATVLASGSGSWNNVGVQTSAGSGVVQDEDAVNHDSSVGEEEETSDFSQSQDDEDSENSDWLDDFLVSIDEE